MTPASELAELERLAGIGLAGLLGIRFVAWSPERVVARLHARAEHRAPNGRVHGGVIVALADTTCGSGTILRIGDRPDGFATIELSCHFLRSPTTPEIECTAHLIHAGATLHHWDAEVRAEGRPCARFRCTELVMDAP